MHDVAVKILKPKHFNLVPCLPDPSVVLVFWNDTDLRNITWQTWVIFQCRWPFIKATSFFVDAEQELFYPEKGSWLAQQIPRK